MGYDDPFAAVDDEVAPVVLATFAEFAICHPRFCPRRAEIGADHDRNLTDVDIGEISLELLSLGGRRLTPLSLRRSDILVLMLDNGIHLTTHIGVRRVGEVPHTSNIGEHCPLETIPLCHNGFLERESPERKFRANLLPYPATLFNHLHLHGRVLLDNFGDTAANEVVLGIHLTSHDRVRYVEIPQTDPL